MDILVVSHRELAHSNFLACIFEPNEPHSLDDYTVLNKTEFVIPGVRRLTLSGNFKDYSFSNVKCPQTYSSNSPGLTSIAKAIR